MNTKKLKLENAERPSAEVEHEKAHTNTYKATLDGGDCGDTNIEATSAKLALLKAIEWAREGNWGDGGCDVLVGVVNVSNRDDCESTTIEIPTQEEEHDTELETDGEIIAEEQGEFSTERVVVMDGVAYYMHSNSGSRGAWNRQCSDGVWRDHPCEPTRVLSKDETRCLMLDWGYSPEYVVKKTKNL